MVLPTMPNKVDLAAGNAVESAIGNISTLDEALSQFAFNSTFFILFDPFFRVNPAVKSRAAFVFISLQSPISNMLYENCF